MLNYSDGADHCKTNSDRLQTTARIILHDSDGTDSFALFLYHIAYEEISKAIFCLFVHRGWVNEEFINKVFESHKYKIFLFEEIFRSFEINNGKGYLGGKRLGDKSLKDFIKEHESAISQHREITKDFLYVDKNGQWKAPSVSIQNIDEEEKKIISKIGALDIIFEFIKNNYDGNSSFVNNFKFYEDKDGNFTVQYDAA